MTVEEFISRSRAVHGVLKQLVDTEVIDYVCLTTRTVEDQTNVVAMASLPKDDILRLLQNHFKLTRALSFADLTESVAEQLQKSDDRGLAKGLIDPTRAFILGMALVLRASSEDDDGSIMETMRNLVTMARVAEPIVDYEMQQEAKSRS